MIDLIPTTIHLMLAAMAMAPVALAVATRTRAESPREFAAVRDPLPPAKPPRELDPDDLPPRTLDDYRPKPLPEADAPSLHSDYQGAVFDQLADKLSRNRLNEIATLMRSLTYGEMIELAAGIEEAKGDKELTGESLPGVLHRWSTGA